MRFYSLSPNAHNLLQLKHILNIRDKYNFCLLNIIFFISNLFHNIPTKDFTKSRIEELDKDRYILKV